MSRHKLWDNADAKRVTDTDHYPVSDHNFTATRDCLQYKHKTTKNSYGEHFRRLYHVTDECAAWDLGADYRPANGAKLMAVGGRHGGYSYIELRTVGRKETKTACGFRGMRVRVLWTSADANGNVHREDETVAWVVKDHFAN
jgi:hypothetical protein